MNFPAEGIFHNIVIISIDKRYPGHARKIMNAVWGLGQLMFSKTVIVVDKDVDVQNLSEVAWIVGTHIDPERDIQFMRGPVDDLEDASDLAAYGSKMGIDATRKWASEGFKRPWPTRIRTTEAAATPGGRDLDAHPAGMEGMTAMSIDEAQAILARPQPRSPSARAETTSAAARHGTRTTFVRVFEVHTDAVTSSAPAGTASAGEIRVTGKPPSVACRRGVGQGGAGAGRARRPSPPIRWPICSTSPAGRSRA